MKSFIRNKYYLRNQLFDFFGFYISSSDIFLILKSIHKISPSISIILNQEILFIFSIS
jgi:hypothetical protein